MAKQPLQPKTSRPSLDTVYIAIARLIGTRSTCRHRDQGAVLVKDGRVISMGYNGAAPGQGHCLDLPFCSKEEGLGCRAEGLHGESNALLTAARLGISTEGSVLYSTYSPCEACCNMLKAAGVVEVVYEHRYDGFHNGPEYLQKLGVKCRKWTE